MRGGKRRDPGRIGREHAQADLAFVDPPDGPGMRRGAQHEWRRHQGVADHHHGAVDDKLFAQFDPGCEVGFTQRTHGILIVHRTDPMARLG